MQRVARMVGAVPGFLLVPCAGSCHDMHLHEGWEDYS